MRIIYFILVSCLILAANITMVGCTEPAHYTEANTTISAKVGQEFVISLVSNPSTGYHWQLTKPLDETVVKLKDSAFQAANTHLIGAPGTELWTFLATGKGKAEISLGYARPWEKDTPPIKTAVFRVESGQ